MLDRNRLLYAAIGGCLAAIIAAMSGWLQTNQCFQYALWPEYRYQTTSQSAPHNNPKDRIVPQPQVGATETVVTEIACQYCGDASERKKQQHDDDDLAAQHAMARAAACSMVISIGQMVAGIIGLVFLGFTLKFTRDTAAAGRSAVQTADAANRLVRENFEKLERPYIYVFGAYDFRLDATDKHGDKVPNIGYTVANFGKTPAIIENACVLISATKTHLPEMPLRVDEDHNLLINRILHPNERRSQYEFAPSHIEFVRYDDFAHPDFTSGDEFFFWVIIDYRDSFGGSYETSACWRWRVEGKSAHFVLFGHDEYNYEK